MTDDQHERFLKEKPFSCNNECKTDNSGKGAECCRFYFIRTLKPRTEIIDVDFYKVHGVEVVERDIPDYIFDHIIGKEQSNYQLRIIQKNLKKLLKASMKEVVFKVNQECPKLSEEGLCTIYNERPNSCKTCGSGCDGDYPFIKIKECPYTKQ